MTHPQRPPTSDRAPDPPIHDPNAPTCDVCGSADVEWRTCKLVCRNCRSIIMSCGDV